MVTIQLPPPAPLQEYAHQLEEGMRKENRQQIKLACNALATAIAASFKVEAPTVRVLGSRPLAISANMVDETFGDYHFETACIRLWMRTAVLEKMTSYGSLLSTLCHEICHHLDVTSFGFPNTYHTRGFYERAAVLYHHVRGTPIRRLVWDELASGTFRINSPETMRGPSAKNSKR